MDSTLGRLTAHLAEPDDKRGAADLISLINRNINPPSPVTLAAVHIRAMYIVSDEINSFGGCFPKDEHKGLCKLLIDSPVMVGHRKDHLPIARNFHAEEVRRDGRRWVKCWFYWLRAADGAETLRENIDGGIYRECSISFTFLMPECSICGKDIRTCSHRPFERYTAAEKEEVCHFRYRQIERVLETSLVYRGAVPNTRLTNAFLAEPPDRVDTELLVQSPTELPAAERYVVTACYDGIPVTAMCSDDGCLRLHRLDNKELPPTMAGRFATTDLPAFEDHGGYLIGRQGKNRCTIEETERFLCGEPSPVTRLELRLIPNEDTPPLKSSGSGKYTVALLPHEICALPEVEQAATRIATRDGVRIRPTHLPLKDHAGYRYRPAGAEVISGLSYTLMQPDANGTAALVFTDGEEVYRFLIRQFHLQRLFHGAKFLADRWGVDRKSAGDVVLAPDGCRCLSGQLIEAVSADNAFRLRLAGKLTGTYLLRPVKIDGVRRHLFYRAG